MPQRDEENHIEKDQENREPEGGDQERLLYRLLRIPGKVRLPEDERILV